ncbi:hypothetical protein F5Y14DRAFT_428535 [Nemania sp. NC0429]|nr:hypothetical protein F5Y14DRAFT_428535 [Nemania sp. NC0429]
MAVEHISWPSRAGGSESSQHVLIVFVPGNPGLIGYYVPFLSALRDLLDASTSASASASPDPITFHIHGQNLAGFADEDHEPFTAQRKPYDLAHQVQHLTKTVSALRIESGARQGQSYDRVVLIGHSVGAYIALETCHRLLRDSALAPPELRLASGILLFPTIERIAESPSGWKLNLLRRVPLLPDHAHSIAQGFLRLWPYDALHWFVSRALGFPPHAADVTTRWLKSRDGVWQALHLGIDELRVIGEDKWDAELWGIEKDTTKSHSQAPRFYFFFGQHDHWVLNRHRDAFIRRRSAQAERTRLVVDEGKLPHAFCIDHSVPVAEKVHAWITELFNTATHRNTR